MENEKTQSPDTCLLLPQGATVDLAGHDSILDAALAAGIPVPFSCRRGACGSCAADCVSGAWESAANAVSDALNPGAGRLLMCQTIGRGKLILQLPDWEPAAAPERRSMRVLTCEALSTDVFRLVLDPGASFQTFAGQHLRLALGQEDYRCFSVANRRIQGHESLELQIRRVQGGRFSDRFLSDVTSGDMLEVEGPYGARPTIGGSSPIVLLATGTGYAGVRAHLEEALADPGIPAITLYWGGRHDGDHYARAELDGWAAADSRLRWVSVSPQTTKGHAGQDEALQRHIQDYALEDGHDWAHTRVYACGHPAMLRDARLALGAAGMPASNWHADAFVPSGPVAHLHEWERSGPRFERAGIVAARERSIAAVEDIAARIRPGMTAQAALAMADERLRTLGSQRNWHPTIVRFGDDTVLTSRERGDPERVLAAEDVFFIDIGPVWDGYEGDYGDTFVTGTNEARRRCAAAARAVFEQTRIQWMAGADGVALYAFAESEARNHGCRLVHETAGHRVSDFPHALYGRHKLAQAGFAPGDGLWVLEIQVRDQELPLGAFFEDVLLREQA